MNKKKQIYKAQPKKLQVKKIPDIVKISKQQLFILFCMLIAVFIAYLPALHKEFINLDDNTYITENSDIANFSFSKTPTIFSHFYLGQYSPAFSIVCGIINMMVGFKPFYFNIFAVVLHLITILLVFKFIWMLCRNFRIAFVTAALFGIATMQVESVAWIAAVYKICTYSILFLLSLISYVSYIKTNKKRYIIISILLFIISCLFKEQAVSLALAVLAIDIYFGRKLLSKKVILEKIPFFLISIVFGIITIAAANSFQQEGLNISSFNIIDRFIYASYAFCTYIYKLFIPVNLSFLYSYFPLENSRFIYLLFPLLVLVIACLYVYAIKKKKKDIIFGGLFFLVNILFSIGLQIVAVRPAIMADRYVYLASIGIFFIVAKGADILIEKKHIKLPIITVFFIAFFLITANLTYSRTKIWKNSITLWNDVINKYQTIAFAYYLRGSEESNRNDFKSAIADYNKAIAIRPNFAKAYFNRGSAKYFIKDIKGTIEDCNKAIALFPNYAEAYLNRGAAKADMGNNQGAIDDFNKAIAIDPKYVDAYENRGITKYNLKDYSGAIDDCNKALMLNPNKEKAKNLKTLAQQELQKINN